MKKLYLLPNLLSPSSTWQFSPPPIDALIAESSRGGRAYLKRFFSSLSLPLYLLNEHTKEVDKLLEIQETNVGLVVDAGLCCIADPGAKLIEQAHKQGITVHTYPGPSSILMALQLSGLTGQKFYFHGYLPKDKDLLSSSIKKMEKNVTHIFIETVYRNKKLLDCLLKAGSPHDHLCLAFDLTGEKEKVFSLSLKTWIEKPPSIEEYLQFPCIFLFYPTLQEKRENGKTYQKKTRYKF